MVTATKYEIFFNKQAFWLPACPPNEQVGWGGGSLYSAWTVQGACTVRPKGVEGPCIVRSGELGLKLGGSGVFPVQWHPVGEAGWGWGWCYSLHVQCQCIMGNGHMDPPTEWQTQLIILPSRNLNRNLNGVR